MSGVVDIRLREPPSRTETELGVSFFNTWGLSRGRFGGDDRGDWLLSARRGNLDLLADAVNPDYGSPRYVDYLAHVGWLHGDHHLSANSLYSYDKISISDGAASTANARYKNSVLWLKVESDWTDSIDSTSILSATEIENQRSGITDRPGVISGSVDDDRHFRSLALKQDWTFAMADTWLVAAGFELKRLEAEYAYEAAMAVAPPFDAILDNEPVTMRSVEAAPRGSQYAVYAELRLQPVDRLTFDAGLRWDQQTYTTARDDDKLSPRFNLLYRVGKRTELRLAFGEYYQAQEINELQVGDGVPDFHSAQRAQHLVASLERELGSGMDLRLEAYQKKYRSLMPRFENLFDPLALIPELGIDRVRIDAQSARSEGLELSLTGTGAHDLAWWASYTWSRTLDEVQGESIRRGWDQPHALNAGFSRDWNAWSFSAAAVVRSGWPKTLLRAEAVENPDGSTTLVANPDPRNSGRHAVFGSLDARVSRRFDLARGDLTVFLEVTNLSNRENPCCTEYSAGLDESGNPVLLASDSTWLPIVPSLGVVWRF
jgi:outer membrane receptor protein involved in Fe transport